MDFVKVLDFGLVKSHGPQGVTEMNLTRDHAVGGTPGFMSPEQVMSDRPLDGRSDIYAVGCLAYWLVTAQLVFTGRTAIETMMHHAQTVPVPPSARTEAVRRRDPGVSRQEPGRPSGDSRCARCGAGGDRDDRLDDRQAAEVVGRPSSREAPRRIE